MEYRRITRGCARRDWDATTHDEIVAQKGNHLLHRFLDVSTSLDYCHAGGNVMDRARDCSGPGPHVIGNMHVKAPEARRAWLWRDTGELDPFGLLAKIDWMIAQGPRRQGHATDLQNSHQDLLCDPEDAWLPEPVDYQDLAAEHDKGWLARAVEAVGEAVREAEQRRGTRIPVDIDKVNAQIVQGEGVQIEVDVAVVEEYAERWVIISRLDRKNTPVEHATAEQLAAAAFLDVDPDAVEEVYAQTEILDGAMTIDPGRFYAWWALVA